MATSTFDSDDRFSWHPESGFRVGIPNLHKYIHVGREAASELRLRLFPYPKLRGKNHKQVVQQPPPSERSVAWWFAQLIHYGLPIAIDREHAKESLRQALLTDTLEVPLRLRGLARKFEREYQNVVASIELVTSTIPQPAPSPRTRIGKRPRKSKVDVDPLPLRGGVPPTGRSAYHGSAETVGVATSSSSKCFQEENDSISSNVSELGPINPLQIQSCRISTSSTSSQNFDDESVSISSRDLSRKRFKIPQGQEHLYTPTGILVTQPVESVDLIEIEESLIYDTAQIQLEEGPAKRKQAATSRLHRRGLKLSGRKSKSVASTNQYHDYLLSDLEDDCERAKNQCALNRVKSSSPEQLTPKKGGGKQKGQAIFINEHDGDNGGIDDASSCMFCTPASLAEPQRFRGYNHDFNLSPAVAFGSTYPQLRQEKRDCPVTMIHLAARERRNRFLRELQYMAACDVSSIRDAAANSLDFATSQKQKTVRFPPGSDNKSNGDTNSLRSANLIAPDLTIRPKSKSREATKATKISSSGNSCASQPGSRHATIPTKSSKVMKKKKKRRRKKKGGGRTSQLTPKMSTNDPQDAKVNSIQSPLQQDSESMRRESSKNKEKSLTDAEPTIPQRPEIQQPPGLPKVSDLTDHGINLMHGGLHPNDINVVQGEGPFGDRLRSRSPFIKNLPRALHPLSRSAAPPSQTEEQGYLTDSTLPSVRDLFFSTDTPEKWKSRGGRAKVAKQRQEATAASRNLQSQLPPESPHLAQKWPQDYAYTPQKPVTTTGVQTKVPSPGVMAPPSSRKRPRRSMADIEATEALDPESKRFRLETPVIEQILAHTDPPVSETRSKPSFRSKPKKRKKKNKKKYRNSFVGGEDDIYDEPYNERMARKRARDLGTVATVEK